MNARQIPTQTLYEAAFLSKNLLPPSPGLSVEIAAEGERITLLGGNPEWAVKIDLPCSGGSSWRLPLPLDPFFGWLSTLIGGEAPGLVSMAPGEGGLELSTEHSRARLSKSLLPSEVLPPEPEGEEMAVDLSGLRYLLRVVEAGGETYQGPLYGVRLAGDGEALRAAASNGYLLLETRIAHPAPLSEVLIPKPAAQRLIRAARGEGEGRISFSEGSLTFRAEGITLRVPRLAGAFPDYTRAIPKPQQTVLLPREETLAVLRRLSPLCREPHFRLEISLREGSLTLSAAGDLGRAEEPLAVEYRGEALDLACNIRLLSTALAHLEADTVSLHIGHPHEALTLEDPGNRALLAQLKV